MRSDQGFQKTLVDARELCDELEIEPKFPLEHTVRPRRKKRQFDYESADEPVLNPENAFKTNVYFVILDSAIMAIKERFDLLYKHNEIFNFLYDIKKEDKNGLLKKCLKLERDLTHENHSDIEGRQLFQEILLLTAELPDNKNTPLEVLDYIHSHGLKENYVNVTTALRILLTLPVSVASGERSFSKLRIIQNYLRSTMTQDRLVWLSTISIERDILDDIDITSIIKDFAEQKARKVSFAV